MNKQSNGHWAIAKNMALACAMTVALANISGAQSPETSGQTGPAGQSLVGVHLKGKVPVNKAVLQVNLPKPVEAKLPNGLQIVVIEDRTLPTFFMQMVLVGSGDAADPANEDGVADATAEMLTEGTVKLNSEQLAQQLEKLGGSLGGGTGTLDTTVSVSGLTEHLDTLLGLFADVVLHPTFPAEELERLKLRSLSQIQQQRANPRFLAQEQFVKAVYGDHPAAKLLPAEESVKQLSSEALVKFHAQHYQPGNAVLLVAGDVVLKELLPKLRSAFGEWQNTAKVSLQLPPANGVTGRQVLVVDRPGSVQTSLILGELGTTADNPDRYALAVMNQILGGGAAGRLFLNLREDKGYTYGAYSSASTGRFAGTVSASAEVRTEVTAGAMKEFVYELKRIATEPVSDVDLINAKHALVGRFALSLENPRSFIGNVFEQKIMGFPSDYWDHYAARIDAITASDVQRVAAKYYDPSRLQIVAVGDAAKIREVMDAYGISN